MSVRLDHGDEALSEIHEINVTPFIDVILVLLIIFMIAAPLATVDISVDLPAANAEQQPRPDKPLFLTLKSDLSLLIDNDAEIRATLSAALDQATAGDKQQRVFVRADKSVPYGDLMALMIEETVLYAREHSLSLTYYVDDQVYVEDQRQPDEFLCQMVWPADPCCARPDTCFRQCTGQVHHHRWRGGTGSGSTRGRAAFPPAPANRALAPLLPGGAGHGRAQGQCPGLAGR